MNEMQVRSMCAEEHVTVDNAPKPKAPTCGGVSLSGVLTEPGPLSPFWGSSVSLKVNPGVNTQSCGAPLCPDGP